ncbi:MAG: TolC family protein [Polyangiaceae bacterium]
MRLRPRGRAIAAAMTLVAALASPGLASAETLTVAQAIGRAAAQNPTLRASLEDVQAAHLSTQAEIDGRDPTLSATVQGGYSENASGTNVNGAGTVSSKVAVSYTTDVGTRLEVGTSADLGWRPSANGSASAAPQLTALAYVTARQPLLRGAGKDVNTSSIVNAQFGETQAKKQQELTASSTALDVLDAYWELWYADRAVEVQEDARRVAAKDYEDAEARLGQLGTGTEIDVLQFSSSLASIEDQLSQAKATRTTRAVALGRLLGMDAKSSAELEPTDSLPMLPAIGTEDALVSSALDGSPDLASLRAGIDSAKLRVDTAIDADQPQLDLFATGQVGTQFANYGGDYTLLGARPVFSLVGGLSLELPLGSGSAPSERARAVAQLHAAQDRYQAKVDQIVADVASKRVDALSAASGVRLAEKTVDVSRRLAKAEQDKFALGTGDASDVVKAEESVREAELRLLRARVDAVTGGYALEHATGSLLDGAGAAMRSSS